MKELNLVGQELTVPNLRASSDATFYSMFIAILSIGHTFAPFQHSSEVKQLDTSQKKNAHFSWPFLRLTNCPHVLTSTGDIAPLQCLILYFYRSIETRSKLGVEALILDPRLMADNNFERDTALLSYKQYAEAAPASTKGRGQAHEGRQKGAWLTIL